MNIEALLSDKINMPQIKSVVSWACGTQENLHRLWEMVHSDDRRTSANALWAMTHLPDYNREWISSLRDDMIDMLLAETDTGKKRMLLHMLREQEYDAEHIRTDFLDYCLSKINSEHEPYAIRGYSIYASFKMCRHYPELLAELNQHLDLLSYQSLSPGLMSALRQTKSRISRLKPV
ncbi:MAG: hypothetical protein K2L41_06195 [Muribaculaceae bacterium]|nr:hypothetical protein [Muribaculaceae bacterium]